jgi:hypothetical protein
LGGLPPRTTVPVDGLRRLLLRPKRGERRRRQVCCLSATLAHKPRLCDWLSAKPEARAEPLWRRPRRTERLLSIRSQTSALL